MTEQNKSEETSTTQAKTKRARKPTRIYALVTRHAIKENSDNLVKPELIETDSRAALRKLVENDQSINEVVRVLKGYELSFKQQRSVSFQ